MTEKQHTANSVPIVEFIGGMGCGKSTIYKELEQACSDTDLDWVLTRNKLIEKKHGEIFVRRDKRIFYKLTKLPVLRRFRARFVTDELRMLGKAKLSDAEYGKLIKVALFERKRYEGKGSHALNRVQYFINDLYEISAIKETTKNDNRIIILDEGIMQRCLSLLFRLEECDEFAEQYCNSVVHVPTLLIHVETDKELALKRLVERGKKRDVHIEVLDTAVEMSKKIVQHMQARGSFVLKLDGAEDPSANARKCLDKIRAVAEQLR